MADLEFVVGSFKIYIIISCTAQGYEFHTNSVKLIDDRFRSLVGNENTNHIKTFSQNGCLLCETLLEKD